MPDVEKTAPSANTTSHERVQHNSPPANGVPNAAADQGPMSREVRLGLVLYGGISLAIYMNGIAHEFFNAVRGRGVYHLIKALTDSDVVVDIVSGASAGGINGIFLAFALCNGKEFAPFKDLWRQQGDVERLLRDPKESPNDTHSLFDSEQYYQQRLYDAFAEVYGKDIEIGKSELPSRFREMDVFVAGTDVQGRVFTTFDDLGHAIDVMDHRTIFQLKHRKERKEPFNPEFAKAADAKSVTFQALATLSRLTSSFPAAFRPVEVPWGGKTLDDSTADGLLQLWGSLRRDQYFEKNQSKFFVDGGVLNNKPFTSTLDAIFHRLANSEVERFMIYVEPDPERFAKPNAPAEEPDFAATVFKSLVSLPGYQGIGADLQELAVHNRRVEIYLRLTQRLRTSIRFSRVPTPAQTAKTATQAVYLRSRLVQLSDRVVRGVLRDKGTDKVLSDEEKQAANDLFLGFDDYMSCAKLAAQQQILHEFDVYFRIRRLFYVVQRIREWLYPPPMDQPAGDCADDERKNYEEERKAVDYAHTHRDLCERARYAFNRQIELLEIVQSAMERLVDEAPIPWAQSQISKSARSMDVWIIVKAALTKLLDAHWVWTAVKARVDSTKQDGDVDVSANILYASTWSGEGTTDWSKFPLRRERKPAHDSPYLEDFWLTQNWLTALNDVLGDRCDAIVNVIQHIIDGEQGRKKVTPQEIVDAINADPVLRSTSGLKETQASTFRSVLADIGDSGEIASDEASSRQDCNHRILSTLLGNDYDHSYIGLAYNHFTYFDAILFPMELASGLRAKNVIKTVRFSPFDAQRGFSKKTINEKVAGLAVHHFGAFFKRSWRSNDILWGRLDGISQLGECLLEGERIRRVVSNPNSLDLLQRRFGLCENGGFTGVIPNDHALHPSNLFPNSPKASQVRIQCWLQDLLAAPNPAGNRKRQASLGAIPLELLTEMAQYEVINETYKDVVEDAVQEQLEWNSYQPPTSDPGSNRRPSTQNPPAASQQAVRKMVEIGLSFEPGTGRFQAGGRFINPDMIPPAAAATAAVWIENIKASNPQANASANAPGDTSLGKHFSSRDRGVPNLLKALPPAVTAQLATRAGMVLRNCVVTALGNGGQGLAKNKWFARTVDWPLRIAYRYAQFWRQTPGEERYWRITIWAVCVALLLVGIGKGKSVLITNEGLSFFWLGALFIAPAVVLMLLFWLGRAFPMKGKGWWLAVTGYALLVAVSWKWLPGLFRHIRGISIPHGTFLPTFLSILGITVLGVAGFFLGLLVGRFANDG